MEFKKKIVLTFAVMGAGILASHAQTGIGTINPDNSAQLDITSATRGVLLPRVRLESTTDKTTVKNPANSLLVFNIVSSNDVTPGFYYWDATKSMWLRIARSDESTFADLTDEEKASLKGETGVAGAKGDTGTSGKDGTSVTIKGSKTNQSQLPATGNTTGDGYIINGDLWVWDGTTFNNVGPIQGPKGDTGLSGAVGATGAQGPKGDKLAFTDLSQTDKDALKGATGATGTQGIAGAVGATGAQGPKGDKLAFTDLSQADKDALKGATGATGTQGIAGIVGATGAQGPKGDKLAFTDLSQTDKDALKGATGAQGLIGLTGAKGDTGTSGKDGTSVTIKGSKTDQSLLPAIGNITGDGYIIKGDLWVWDGIAFNNVGPIQGPKGDAGSAGSQGIAGAVGATGAQGPKGDKLAFTDLSQTDKDALKGATGATGTQGIAGAVGATGAQGPKGDKLAFTDLSQADKDALKGATGATGTQGIAGVVGATGAQGIAGAVGATGAQGPKGDKLAFTDLSQADKDALKGATGATGTQGIAGAVGATGAQGPKGDKLAFTDLSQADKDALKGATGATGTQGIAGAVGATGAQGPKGDKLAFTDLSQTDKDALKGATGATGTQGIAGAVGATGAQGIAGAVGATGSQGPKGDKLAFTDLSQADKDALKGATGAQGLIGLTGAKGDTGTTGKDGTSVTIKGSKTNQSLLPATGNTTGDGYIIDGNLWVWDGTKFNNVGPIQGPKGDAGVQGIAGAVGATGVQGPKGDKLAFTDLSQTDKDALKGATGATGTQGIAGAVGATGTQGPKGDKLAFTDLSQADKDALKGATGATGAQGIAGAIGATGAQGLIGLTGAKGDTGASGATVTRFNLTSANSALAITGAGKVMDANTTLDIVGGTAGQILTSNGASSAAWKDVTGDNLGNHIATTDLNMSGKNINNVAIANIGIGNITTGNITTANIAYAASIKDRYATNVEDFTLYKNNGLFGLYNSKNKRNELSIDEVSGKTTLTSAQISKGTDGIVPQAGYVATSVDTAGNIVWKNPATMVTTQQVVDEYTAGVNQLSFTLTAAPVASSKLKLFINGVRIDRDAITVIGSIATYVPAKNGSYALMANDIVMIDYLK